MVCVTPMFNKWQQSAELEDVILADTIAKEYKAAQPLYDF